MKEQNLLGSAEDDSVDKKGAFEYEEALPDDELTNDFDIRELIKHRNVAELLSDEELDELAAKVISDYEMDKTSRSHREQNMDEAMNLALQVMEEKTFPWPGASAVSYPLIAEASITFAARAYPAIVRGDQIAVGKVVGSDKGMPQPLIDPMTGQPAIDPQTGQPAIQMVGAGEKKAQGKRVSDYMNYQLTEEIEGWEEDTDKLLTALPITGNMFRKMYWNAELGRPESCLVFPRHLVVNYKAKSLERAPRITEEVELYPYEIMERIRFGSYLDFNFNQSHEQDSALSEGDAATGLQSDWHNPHLFLQQYRKMDLDGDGYPEPYIVTVHKDTQKVARILANYHEDGITIRNGKIAKIKCEEYYIKYGFLPSPDGSFYDIGFGELLLSLNKTINATINRLMDAGTLANTSQGFLARGVKIRGGEHKFRPGMFKSVDTRGMPLKDSFVQIQHPEPSPVVFQLLGFLTEAGKSLGSLRDVLSSEQMASISGIAALAHIEQGLTAFKSIYKRVRRSMKEELRILYRINSIYLDEVQYYTVMDDERAIARNDFDLKRIDIAPAADLSVVTDMQRMAKAQFLMEFKDDAYCQGEQGIKVRERIFEYVGEDFEGLIGAPPPPPEDPNIKLVEGQIQVEQYKAQIKEMEAQSKTQKEALMFQLEQAKAEAKAALDQQQAQAKYQLEQLSAQIKAQEAEFKIQKLMQELAIKQMEGASKDAKTQAEIEKINKQIDLLEQQRQLELARAQAAMLEKQQKESKEMEDKEEKKESSKELTEAIKALKGGKKKVTVKKDEQGNISGEISGD